MNMDANSKSSLHTLSWCHKYLPEHQSRRWNSTVPVVWIQLSKDWRGQLLYELVCWPVFLVGTSGPGSESRAILLVYVGRQVYFVQGLKAKFSTVVSYLYTLRTVTACHHKNQAESSLVSLNHFLWCSLMFGVSLPRSHVSMQTAVHSETPWNLCGVLGLRGHAVESDVLNRTDNSDMQKRRKKKKYPKILWIEDWSSSKLVGISVDSAL